MMRIFKFSLRRYEDGYTVDCQVIYFKEGDEYEQSDHHGKALNEPVFTLSPDRTLITELTNPDALGLSEHETQPVISDLKALRREWDLAKKQPRLFFTILPINVFSDRFYQETLC